MAESPTPPQLWAFSYDPKRFRIPENDVGLQNAVLQYGSRMTSEMIYWVREISSRLECFRRSWSQDDWFQFFEGSPNPPEAIRQWVEITFTVYEFHTWRKLREKEWRESFRITQRCVFNKGQFKLPDSRLRYLKRDDVNAIIDCYFRVVEVTKDLKL